MSDHPGVGLLCRLLREEPFAWPTLDADSAGRLYDTARAHGVHLLLAGRLGERGWGDCPPAFRDRLAGSLRSQLAVDEITRRELVRVLAALAAAGVDAVLVKGAALAFTHYPDPVLRPRVDTDLLIDAGGRERASATLEAMGYHGLPSQAGELVIYQAPYAKTDAHGVHHVVDLHWKVSNPQVFASALTYDEVRAEAVDLPQLGDRARGAGAVHALALACIHRVAHHADHERLIWLYDMHLLAARLTEDERHRFLQFAAARQILAVCAAGVAQAHRRFGGAGTHRLAELIAAHGVPDGEPGAPYLGGAMRKIDVLASDLHALNWSARIRLLREHLVPPRAHMRQVYGVSGAALPLMYVWRIARGARSWWRKGQHQGP
jgi:hypothetical protein